MNSLLDPFLYQLKHFLLITSPLMVQMILLISVISQNMFFLIFHINYVQTSVWYIFLMYWMFTQVALFCLPLLTLFHFMSKTCYILHKKSRYVLGQKLLHNVYITLVIYSM